MKKLMLLLPVVFFLTACGSNSPDSASSFEDSDVQTSDSAKKSAGKFNKSLIVYYSLTENTKAVAEAIQRQAAGEIVRIETVEAYPTTYSDVLAVVQAQMDNNELPEIVPSNLDLAEYETIFIGAPIWFGQPALPLKKWLAENDLSGKTVLPFFTSGSSSIAESMNSLKASLSKANLLEGLGVTTSERKDIPELVEKWLSQSER